MAKKLLNKIYNLLNVKSERTKNITKHVLLSFFYKGGSMLSTFLLVPLTINYLETDNYGVWLTLSSFIACFSFFDIGLGYGLRNRFAEARAQGNKQLARAYVSSAYFTIGILCLFLIIVFVAINYFVDWTKVFNTNSTVKKDLTLLMPIVFTFFCLQLVASLITTIYASDLNHSMPGKINFFTQVGSLLFLWLATLSIKSSLLIFGIIISAVPVLILLFLNFFAFLKTYKDFKPTSKLWKKKYLKDIFGLGLSFFFVQMAWIVISTTDSFIIAQLYSPKEVVPYSIAMKYFSIPLMMLTIIVAPYWSSFTEAVIKNDFVWIKKAIKNLRILAIGFCCMCILLLFLSKYMYKMWLGDEILIPFKLSVNICIYTCLIIYLTPLNYFINGIGKIKLQLYQTLVFAMLNIPVSIFLAKYLQLGVEGVVLGSILCIVPSVILSSIQNNKIISKKASGIWNK